MIERWTRSGLEISTDPARLDADAIHAYLSASYWAAGRPRDVVEKSLKGSLCFGLYEGRTQIGLARVVTDYATYAYLCDVYVRPDKQGAGLGKWLLDCVLASEALAPVKAITLKTRDAHGLYERYGFTRVDDPERAMVLRR